MARGAGRAPVRRPLVKPESDRGTATQPRSWRPERGARLRAAPMRREAPGDRAMRSPEQTVKRTIRVGEPQPYAGQLLEFLRLLLHFRGAVEGSLQALGWRWATRTRL